MYRLNLLVLIAASSALAGVTPPATEQPAAQPPAVTADPEDLSGKAADLVKAVNAKIREAKLAEVKTPDQSYSNILSSGSVKNAVFRDLSSLSLSGEKQSIKRTTTGAVQDVTFDLTLSLDKFQVEYDYSVKFLRFLGSNGHLVVTAGRDSFRLQGTLHRDGDQCQAAITVFQLLELDHYSADISPKTFFNRVISFFANLARYISTSSDFKFFANFIQQYITQDEFKNNFSNIFCSSLNF